MTSIISQIICGTRNLMSQGFRSLPVLLTSTIFVLGMAQGNINLLFFFIGLAVLSPAGCLSANLLWEFIFSNSESMLIKSIFSVVMLIIGILRRHDGLLTISICLAFLPWLPISPDMWKLAGGNAEQCNLFAVGSTPDTINVVPTYWLTIMAFFFTYLISNANNLYNKQTNSIAPKAATEARKFQTMTSMVLLIAAAIIFTILRFATACETPLGIIIGWIVGAGLGYGWYKFMRNCGLGRLDDIFGISNRLLPYQSYQEPTPTVCVPST